MSNIEMPLVHTKLVGEFYSCPLLGNGLSYPTCSLLNRKIHLFQYDMPLAIINLLDEASDGYTSHVPAGVLQHSLYFSANCRLVLLPAPTPTSTYK